MHWQYTPVQSVQPLTNDYYGVHSTVQQRVADSFSNCAAVEVVTALPLTVLAVTTMAVQAVLCSF